MRSALNAWLRRWAEASLRTELHQAQERLIKQQEKTAKYIANAADQEKSRAARDELRKQRQATASAYDTKLIKALRERMPSDLFLSVAEYVRANENRKKGG